MITLYVYGPALGLPDPSPFVTKTLVQLKMSGLDFVTQEGDPRSAPKHKLPYINDQGTIVADSSFIQKHLEHRRGIDFSGGYGAADLATGMAIQRMLEEHLYWLVAHARWIRDEDFNRGPRIFFDKLPALMRPFVIAMVRRQVRQSLQAQGLGRHTDEERLVLAQDDLAAVSGILDDRPYLLGDRICGYDAVAYAFARACLTPSLEHPLRQVAEQYPNLQAYLERMTAEFFPESGR